MNSYFKVDFKKRSALISLVSLALSIPLRIAGYYEFWGRPLFLITQVFLPVLCAALMIIILIKYGKTKLIISTIPVSLGVLSFVFKLFIDPRFDSLLHHIVCALLYSAIIILWFFTVSGKIRSKWIIVILFALPFLFHIFVEDARVLLGYSSVLSASMWLKEFSMLCMMFGLSMCGLSFEKN